MRSGTLGRRSELAVELLLLLRCEKGADLIARLAEHLVTLALEFLPEVGHFAARLLYDFENLIVLRGRQVEPALHPFDKGLMRNVQQPEAVRQAGRRETNPQTRKRDDYNYPGLALS